MFVLSKMVGLASSLFLVTWSAKVVGIDVKRDTTSKDTVISCGAMVQTEICGIDMSTIAMSACLHSHLNSINAQIRFTVEEEKDGSIAFLDTKTTRNPDGTIKTSVYRKATHTDKYLQFNSQHKRSVARTLLDRVNNPSTDADKLSEVQHVVDALKIIVNGYTDQFIRSCQSTIVSTNQP